MAESRIKLLKNCWSTEIREDSDICLKKKLWKKKGPAGDMRSLNSYFIILKEKKAEESFVSYYESLKIDSDR